MQRPFRLGVPVLLLAASASAQPATPPVELRHDTAADLFVTGSGVYVAVLFQLELQRDLVPAACRWCTPPGFDQAARDALLWKNPSSAATLGTLTGFVAAPVAAIGMTHVAAAHDGRADEAWLDDLLITESTATTIAFTDVIKVTVGRARPAVYYRTSGWEGYSAQERNVSFFSGHSSVAFSLAVSSGTVASMRGYRLAPLVWGVGLPIAAFTAYSRVAADAHYMSDVVTGSLVGAAIGFSMPYFFHAPVGRADASIAWRPAILPLPNGAAVGIAGRL